MQKLTRILQGPFPGIMLILLLTPLALYQSTLSMMHVWYVNETFTHGFLIFPISIWMMWQNRNALNAQPVRQENSALLLLIPILCLWYVARIVDVQVAQHTALILSIPTIVLFVFGRHVFMSAAFPLAYLIFAVPAGQGLIPVMMEFTANFTVRLVQLVGVPIYQDGLYFTLPSGNWSVVEECSGVRYLIASMALGTMYAYLTYTSRLKRTIFIALSIIVPIIANGLRAFGIVMIGHYSGMKLATGVDHLVYGWVFFGFIIFLMFYIGSYWRDEIGEEDPVSETGNDARGKQPQNIFNRSFYVTLLLLLCFNLASEYRTSREFTLPSSSEAALVTKHSKWSPTAASNLGWSPLLSKPDQMEEHVYESEIGIVQVNLAFYFYQRQGAEAVSTENRLIAALKDDWAKISSTNYPLDDVVVEETIIRKGQKRVLTWKWYRVGSRLTANIYVAKAIDAINQVILDRNDAAMLTLATPLGEDIEKSRAVLTDFYDKFSQQIYTALEQQADNFQQLN